MTKKHSILVLIVIVALSLALRAWNLGEVPFGRDEFLDINAAVGYAQTGQWQAWDHNMGKISDRINPASDERAWIYRWQVAKLFAFLPPTEAVSRSVSVFWGVITTILVYLVGASLTKRRQIGLIAAAFFALSINAIEMDRTLRMYAMFAPVFLSFAWLVFLSLERTPRDAFGKKLSRLTGLHPWYFLGAVSLGALSLHLHLLTVNIALALLVYLSIMAVSEIRKGKKRNKYSVLLLSGFLSAVLIMILRPHEAEQALAGLKFFEDHYSYLSIVLRDFQHPLIGLILIVFGAIALARSGERRESLFLSSLTGGIIFAAVFLWNRVVGEQYVFFVVSFASILLGSGVYYLAEYLSSQLYGRRVFAVVLALSFLLVPNYGYFFSENNTYRITSRADRPDYRKVFTFVRKHSIAGDVLVTRNFRNYYWSGMRLKTYDFGSERTEAELTREGKVSKITREYIEKIVEENPSGWVIFSDNDEKFITKEARAWLVQNLRKISHPNVRGKISVYRWGGENEKLQSDNKR